LPARSGGAQAQTGQVTELFNPRTEKWDAHFLAAMGPLIPQGIAIQGLTPAGRATVQVLGLNDEMRQLIRYELLMEGLYIVATA
jgi:hypothetical protein